MGAKNKKKKRGKKRVSGWKLPEWSGTVTGRIVSASCLIGNERAARLHVRPVVLIGLVANAPAGVSRANAK